MKLHPIAAVISTLLATLAGTVAASLVVAAQGGLYGTWTEAAQGNTIEIRPCSEYATTLCVLVLSDRPDQGQKSRAGNVVAHQLVATQPNQWSGEFLSPVGQRFPMQITLTDADRFTYKVCVMPGLCDAGAYRRVAP